MTTTPFPSVTAPVLLIAGNPIDGIAIYGPFLDTEAAGNYAEEQGIDQWWTSELNRPASNEGAAVERVIVEALNEVEASKEEGQFSPTDFAADHAFYNDIVSSFVARSERTDS